MDSTKPEIPKACRALDGFVRTCGAGIAWLNVLLVAVILLQVVLRYVFGMGLVYLEELQWHLFGVLIMFGIGYGVVVDAHIRLDLVHRRFSPRTRAAVEILGILFMLFPMILVVFIHGVDFVESAFRVAERSDSPLGLPYRWLIKSVVPASMAFLAVAAVSRLIKSFHIFFRKNG
jgi:TRAP-type mannitol/chloroaromatic compound transport system permease small subunit